jgi:acetyl esterase
MIRLMSRAYPDLGRTVTDADEARRLYGAAAKFPPGRDVAAVEDRRIPGLAGAPEVPVRVFWPHTDDPAPPILVFMHGGGWVLCDVNTHDGVCRLLADDAGMIVVSVDYRRAPEARFPAAADDAYAVVRWAREHAAELGGRTGWLAVAGDSAGGNLATAAALRARDLGEDIVDFQLLIYPVTDCFAPRTQNAEGYLLTSRHMRWYVEQYLADLADGEHPYASPLRAPDLAGVAPATVITAEFDPLCPEGNAYADRLRMAGVPTELHEVSGMFHGPFGLGELVPVARIAENIAVAALRAAAGTGQAGERMDRAA